MIFENLFVLTSQQPLLKHIWTSITSIFVLIVLVITITTSIPPVVVYATTIYCLPGVNCIGTDNDDKIVGSSDVMTMTSMEKEAMIPLLVLMVLTLSQVETVPMKYLVEREVIKFMEVTGMMNYQVVQEMI
jgi:PhoPQ-activated pathogenicity-related protein